VPDDIKYNDTVPVVPITKPARPSASADAVNHPSTVKSPDPKFTLVLAVVKLLSEDAVLKKLL
jgi:hypothetical protein